MSLEPRSGDLVTFEGEPVGTVFDVSITPATAIVNVVRGGQHFDVPLAMFVPHQGQQMELFTVWGLTLPLHHAAIDDHRLEEVRHDAG